MGSQVATSPRIRVAWTAERRGPEVPNERGDHGGKAEPDARADDRVVGELTDDDVEGIAGLSEPSSYVDLGGPRSLNDREEEATHVRQTFRFMPVLAMLVALTIGCTAISGKSARENVDDAKITASVKTKLAEEKVATLTKVDVDTNKGTVYLTGNVENAAIKARATQIAYEVSGVREVVNNLKIQ